MRQLVFFHAPWCRPCKVFERVLIDPLEAELPNGKIRRVNVQDDPFTAEKYGVTHLPTALVVEGERVLYRFTGPSDLQEVKRLLL